MHIVYVFVILILFATIINADSPQNYIEFNFDLIYSNDAKLDTCQNLTVIIKSTSTNGECNPAKWSSNVTNLILTTNAVIFGNGTIKYTICEKAGISLEMNISLDCDHVSRTDELFGNQTTMPKNYNATVKIEQQFLENCISHICVNNTPLYGDNDEEIHFQWQLVAHYRIDKNCGLWFGIVSAETLLIIILISIVIGRWIKDAQEKREDVLQARRRMATLDDFLSPVQRGQMNAKQTIEHNDNKNNDRKISQIPNNRKSSDDEIVACNIPSRVRPSLKELSWTLEKDRQESLTLASLSSMAFPPQSNPDDMTEKFATLNRRIKDEKCNRSQTPPFRPQPIRIGLSALELPKLDSATHNYDAIESLTSGFGQSNDNDDDSIYYNTFGKSRSQLTSSIEYIAREQHSPDD